MGVSFQQVQKYERGINTVSPAKLVQLAKLFGCSLDTLCGFELIHLSRETRALLAVVDDKEFLDRSDFHKTQALIRHFLNITSPELRKVAYNMAKSIASLPR